MGSPKGQVRAAAAHDLSQYIDSSAGATVVSKLEQLTVEDSDIEVRVAAILALVDGGAKQSAGLIVQLARSGVPRVRQIALLAVAELVEPGKPEAIDVALQAVGSPLPALRYQGLVALKSLQQADSLAVIMNQLTDEDSEVRWVAVRLLEELCIRASPADSVPVNPSQKAINDAVRPLLKDPSPRVALAATLLLSRLKDATAVKSLVGWLSRSVAKLDPQDEQAAIELVGQLGLTSAKADLERRAWPWLWEGPTTFAARVALAQLGDERARQAILQNLFSNSPIKCARAIEAAGKVRLEQARARLEYLLANPSGFDVDAIQSALLLLGEPRQ